MVERVRFKAIVDFYEKRDEIRKEKLDEIIRDIKRNKPTFIVLDKLEKLKEEL